MPCTSGQKCGRQQCEKAISLREEAVRKPDASDRASSLHSPATSPFHRGLDGSCDFDLIVF